MQARNRQNYRRKRGSRNNRNTIINPDILQRGSSFVNSNYRLNGGVIWRRQFESFTIQATGGVFNGNNNFAALTPSWQSTMISSFQKYRITHVMCRITAVNNFLGYCRFVIGNPSGSISNNDMTGSSSPLVLHPAVASYRSQGQVSWKAVDHPDLHYNSSGIFSSPVSLFYYGVCNTNTTDAFLVEVFMTFDFKNPSGNGI